MLLLYELRIAIIRCGSLYISSAFANSSWWWYNLLSHWSCSPATVLKHRLRHCVLMAPSNHQFLINKSKKSFPSRRHLWHDAACPGPSSGKEKENKRNSRFAAHSLGRPSLKRS